MRKVGHQIIEPDFAALNQVVFLLVASTYQYSREDLPASAHSMDNLLHAHDLRMLETVADRDDLSKVPNPRRVRARSDHYIDTGSRYAAALLQSAEENLRLWTMDYERQRLP